jgi:hypothetical protein
MISYTKSNEMPERERNMQKDKWKAASRSYRLRKRMANTV